MKSPLLASKLREIFGEDLPQAELFVSEVKGWLKKLYSQGTKATVEEAYR